MLQPAPPYLQDYAKIRAIVTLTATGLIHVKQEANARALLDVCHRAPEVITAE
jgi:hypothetical protein